MIAPAAALALVSASLTLVACSGAPTAPTSPVIPPAAAPPERALRPPSAFQSIADRAQRSAALFAEASRVLTHARCVNCHPADDTPRQGDDHALHDPPVVRGPYNRGIPGLGCSTCHQDRNIELARVPGAPQWHLAPASMAWLDRSPGQICAQLKDPARNGGRTLAQVVDHVAHDTIVAWGFAPGAGRSSPPGSQAELAALMGAWMDTGAACPTEEAKR